MKTAIATVGAAAALGLVALNYQAPESTNLFLSDVMTHEDYEFIRYVAKYGKSYGTKAEFEFRSAQFKQTLAKIAAHNEENGTSTHGVNLFSDMTQAEYRKRLGYKPKAQLGAKNVAVLPEDNLADEVNWVTKGADNAVHAGLSLPLVLLKVLNSSPLVLSNPTLSNNLLTAHPHSEMRVAMVVSWTLLSNTLNKTPLN